MNLNYNKFGIIRLKGDPSLQFTVEDLVDFLTPILKIYNMIIALLLKNEKNENSYYEYEEIKKIITRDEKSIENYKSEFENDLKYFEKKLIKNLESKELKEIYKNINKYVPASATLRIQEIHIGSPVTIRLEGLADVIKVMHDIISNRFLKKCERLLELMAIYGDIPLLKIKEKKLLAKAEIQLMKYKHKVKKKSEKYGIAPEFLAIEPSGEFPFV